MADLERSIKVLLLGEDVDLDKTLINSSKDFDKFSSKIQDATAPLSDLGTKAALTEAAIIAMVAGGMIYAIDKSADFQSGFLETSTLIDDTGKSVDNFRTDILNYASDSKKSIEDINGAIYSSISAGVDYEKSIGSLSEAEKLSIAGKADLNSSLVVLASTLNAYGENTDQASRYADILFTTVKKGQTTLPELADKLSQVTGIAANAGVPFETLSAAISTLTATGMPTSEAITNIKAALSNIIKPSSEASKMADELGLTFDLTSLKSKGLAGFLDSVSEATGGNVEKMAKLFGSTEALNAVLTLTGKGAEKFKDDLEAMASSTGAVAVAYDKMSEDIKLSVQQMLNNIDIVFIKSGDKISGGASGIVEAVTSIFKQLGVAVDSGAFDEIFDFINQFFDDTETLLEDVAENLPEALAGVDFSVIIKALKDLGGEVGNAFELISGKKIDLTTVDGLKDGIQTVVNLFASLTSFTAGFIEGMNPLFSTIGKMVDGIEDADQSGAKLAGNVVGWAKNLNVLFSSLDTIKTVLGVILTIVTAGPLLKGIKTFYDTFTLIDAALTLSLSSNVESLSSKFTILGTSLKTIGGILGAGWAGWEIGRWIGEFNDGAVDKAAQGFFKWTDELLNWTGTKGTKDAKEAGQEIGGAFADKFEEAASADYLEDFWKKAASGSGDVNQAIEEVISSLEDVETTVGKIPDYLKLEADATSVEDELFKLTTNSIFIDGLEVPIAAKTPEGPAVYTWTDENGNLHFSDKKESGGELAKLPEIAIQMHPALDEQAAKDTVDKTKTFIEEIKANADVLQTSIEWEAKVKISQAETDLKKVEAAFSSVDNSITETSDLLGDLFSTLSGGDLNLSDKWLMRDAIEQQLDLQQQSFDLQQKLITAQTDLLNLRKEAMEKGEGLLTIKIGDAVTPALKLVLMEILELTQVELNEYADQYLSGIY